MWNFYASRGRNAIGESPTISLGDFTRDEPGGERDSGIILKKKAESFAELDDKAGAELAREIDFGEAGAVAGQAAGWIRGVVWTSRRGCTASGEWIGGDFRTLTLTAYTQFTKKEPGSNFLEPGIYLATTYSHRTYRPNTIGAAAFHFRVRKGTGWFHRALVTRVQPCSDTCLNVGAVSLGTLSYVKKDSMRKTSIQPAL